MANPRVAEAGQNVEEGSSSASASTEQQSSPRVRYSLNKLPNELRTYSSYNCIFTLACLTADELNNPDSTYRVRDPQVTVLRSGGGAQGKVLTAYETADKKVEYFIDNVEIESIIAPTTRTRTSNATTISFEVTEPYSMGLFLQTLMLAAKTARGNDSDYLKAGYALIIDFIGWTDSDTLSFTNLTRRIIPVKFSQIEFDVDAGGSKYTITAYAWNEQSQSDSIQTINEDTKIIGSTVREVLQTGANSLTNKINSRIRDGLQENTALVPDEYVIIFPESIASSSLSRVDAARQEAFTNAATVSTESSRPGADTADPGVPVVATRTFKNVSSDIIGSRTLAEANPIGASKMIDSNTLLESATVPFGLPQFILKQPESEEDNFTPYYDNGRLQIDLDRGEFTFPGGTTIEKMIEEIIILSTYGQSAATTIQENSEGNIPWFRIQTQTFVLPDAATRARTGEDPKIYVYVVVPYEVHSSVFVQSRNQSVGIRERSLIAVKEYNYIYTGLNEDILDFQIQFNAAFFNALSPNLGNTTGGIRAADPTSSAAQNRSQITVGQGETQPSDEPSTPTRESSIANRGPQEGGDSRSSAAIQAARTFNEAIVNSSVDLISLELKIMGDPYFIADSGVGNYSSPPGDSPAITRDGTMNYQTREVDVVLNFRTPIDYNEAGGMDFPEDTVVVEPFSGLYRVLTVTNKFSSNNFEQTLSMIRRPNQEREGTPGGVRVLILGENREGAVSGQSSTTAGGNSNAETTGAANSASSTTSEQLIPASGTATAINEATASIGERLNDIDQAGRVRGGL
jgi:hypothetical protein